MMRKIIPVRNCRIGLLGGSFNPPHIGHLNISLKSLKKFNLSKIIWLVTPCSPLKSSSIYEDLQVRVKQCQEMIQSYSNKIEVIDIEKNFRNFYSSESIKEIKKWHRDVQFYWIIGCDNLLNIYKWRKWKMIFKMTKVIVCERTLMALKAHNTKAVLNFNTEHIINGGMVEAIENDLYIFHTKKITISSTEIRDKKNDSNNI